MSISCLELKKSRKQVVVSVVQLTELNIDDVAEWCGGSWDEDIEHRLVLFIQTLEGEMTAHVGDWIIQGVSGEFYPCKPAIFEKTYEVVSE